MAVFAEMSNISVYVCGHYHSHFCKSELCAIIHFMLLETYKKMFLIRTAEEQIADYYIKNKIMSLVHFYIGQEAIAVGICDALKKDDRVMGNHRSHGHYLAKGSLVCQM